MCNEDWYIENNKASDYEQCSAFTVSELLEMLPRWIDTKKNEPFNNFSFNLEMCIIIENREIILQNDAINAVRHYKVNYHCNTIQFASGSPHFPHVLFKNIIDKSAANALAKCLIYLIENKLMEIKNESK